MIPYIPHSPADIDSMLKKIGAASVDELFADIPESIRLQAPLELPPSMAEADVMAEMERLADRNVPRILFAGAGMYDHVIPAVVPHLTGRSEFVTAYTPYQPEISQGILQVLFEFQSAVAEITGLQVSNASLYDGATAAAEACTMALNARRKSRILLIAGTVHPNTRRVLGTYFGDLDVELRFLGETAGRVELRTLTAALEEAGEEFAGVLVQTPNFYGALEDLSGWSEAVHAAGGRLIVSAHPLSLGALASPAEWGADLAVGDTQPLGLPPCFGGPSAGYIACVPDLMRRMPGRIVGMSADADGRRAFVLTLQAREQHIKRERATSNICSNQSLAALANTVYLTALGPRGFAEAAERNIAAAAELRRRLTGDLGLEEYVDGPVFNEFTLRIPGDRKKWEAPFTENGLMSGVRLSDLDPQLPPDLLAVAVTEKRTVAEMDRYVACAREALK